MIYAYTFKLVMVSLCICLTPLYSPNSLHLFHFLKDKKCPVMFMFNNNCIIYEHLDKFRTKVIGWILLISPPVRLCDELHLIDVWRSFKFPKKQMYSWSNLVLCDDLLLPFIKSVINNSKSKSDHFPVVSEIITGKMGIRTGVRRNPYWFYLMDNHKEVSPKLQLHKDLIVCKSARTTQIF